MTGPLLRVRGLCKSFGPHVVLDGVDLDVAPGGVTVLLGPSGSGKSTLLRCINHLEKPDAGFVELAARSSATGSWAADCTSSSRPRSPVSGAASGWCSSSSTNARGPPSGCSTRR